MLESTEVAANNSTGTWWIDNNITIQESSRGAVEEFDKFVLGELGKEGTHEVSWTDNEGQEKKGTFEANVGRSRMSNNNCYIYVYSFDGYMDVSVVDKYTGTEYTNVMDKYNVSGPNEVLLTLDDGTEVKFGLQRHKEDYGGGCNVVIVDATIPDEYDGLLFKVNGDTPIYFWS